jgi:hypothetical protein
MPMQGVMRAQKRVMALPRGMKKAFNTIGRGIKRKSMTTMHTFLNPVQTAAKTMDAEISEAPGKMRRIAGPMMNNVRKFGQGVEKNWDKNDEIAAKGAPF